MFKQPQKRTFLIRRILLSVLATVSVLIIVTASILFMLGYRLDSGNGRLEQGALLQFDSKPNGADVWVDGKSVGSQTATKQTVLAGTHTVKMSKAGYEDWSRTLSLDAGTLTWLDYTRFVPKNLKVEPVAAYKSLAGFTFSPDLKWALGLEDATVPTFQLVDLRSETIKSSALTLSPQLYTTQPNTASTFSMYRWNSEGRYVIIKHVYGDQTEWLMVDTQDLTKSVNITKLLSVNLTDIQFAGTNGTSLYGLNTDGVVRKIDLSAGTISRALVSNVSSFSVFEDESAISYVGVNAADANKKVVGIYKDGDNDPTILQTATNPTDSLAIALGRYFSDDYVAIADNNMVTIFTGSLPNGGSSSDSNGLRKYGELTLKGTVSNLSFSDKGDYVLAQSGSEFMSYEIEHQRSHGGMITPAAGAPASSLKWLDTAHLWNDDSNSLMMRDFDGTNVHTIMPVASGFGASLSTNGKFFYGIGKTDTGYQLQRVRMILN